MLRQTLVYLVSLLLSATALAQDLAPFHASYSASYRGLRATAERSLITVGDSRYQLNSTVSLKLLGRTLTHISEESLFTWNGDGLRPHSYAFVQTGIGERARRVDFDWQNQVAEVRVDENLVTLPLEGRVFDELNAYLEMKRQLAGGAREISFMALDKDRIEEERYRVVSEESIETPLGLVQAVALEKVREPESTRVTRIWLAPAWDYLMVKLYQRDADGREMEMALTGATLDGQALSLAVH